MIRTAISVTWMAAAAIAAGAEDSRALLREIDLSATDLLIRPGGGAGVALAGGVLTLDGTAHRDTAVFLRQPEGAPAEVAFEFQIADAGDGARGCGAIVSSRSSLEYLSVHLDRYRQTILVRASESERWGEIARQGGLEYGTGSWHRARIAFTPRDRARSDVRVEIDGRAALEKSGVDVGTGRFGFYATDGRVSIRKLSILAIPGPLDPPWREVRVPRRHVVVCADAGAGGYEAFPDVCRLRSGELLCVFYAGFGHVSLASFAPGGKLPPECPKNGRVCMVRSRDSGRTWSRAEVVVDTPLDDRDPSIVELADGTLLVVYFSLDVGAGGSGYRFVTSSLVRSKDGGRSWSEPEKLFPDWAVSSPVRVLSAPPSSSTEPSTPRLALALYYVGEEKAPGKGYGGVSFSTDGGVSWSRPVAVGKDGPLELDAEPDLVDLPGGRLLMALRPVLALSASEDGGRTWSRPESIGFPAHCPYFLRLRSGLLIMAHRLPGTSLHVSRDDGRTWGDNVPIDSVGGAYPSLCELGPPFPDGTCFVVYYEEGPGSSIRGRWLRATRDGIVWLDPDSP